MKEISKKVILVGPLSVGKTSMVQRFVHQKFSEQYISTIGVRIEKKILQFGDLQLTMIIWDLAGENSQVNTPQSYFLGTNGIIYVVDLTRPPSFLSLKEEHEFLTSKLPDVPIVIAGNKADLLKENELAETLKIMPIKPDFITSAKTGEGVKELFQKLGEQILHLGNPLKV